MRVEFSESKGDRPPKMICEAEIVFDDEYWGDNITGHEPNMLYGMKLVGLAVWREADGTMYVTFPSRAFGTSTERRYFDFLRGTGENSGARARAAKAWVLAEFKRQGEPFKN